MKKVELLSPVGNKEMLYYAIHNGADAVYLAGKKYGARKFADNFTDEELIEAIKYCHLYNVKIYITINTLIYESEINEFLEYVKFLYLNNVDAVIMQDIGMIKLVKDTFPNLEIHASTQCHSNNSKALELFKDLGCQRVVLAREMSLQEIKEINVDIEKEVFVYGALCVCYSGCCLFSSLNGGRSGNRGECVGSCRLPYKLIQNDQVVPLKEQYLLSTKDLNTLNHLREILDTDITSLKIEGRMKSPEYVGYVTKVYRTLIDKYYAGLPLTLTKEEETNLLKLFNREFTEGYLFQAKDITNIKSPNHQGIPIGKVIKIDKSYIYIKLTDDLYQEDGIRFKNANLGLIVNRLYNDKILLTSKVSKGNICLIDNKFNLSINDTVLKTIDKHLSDTLKVLPTKKIPISFICEFNLNKPFKITITDGVNTCNSYGEVVERANKSEVTEDNITKCLNKLGSTPYIMDNIKIIKDDFIFVNLKSINIVRRSLIDKLTILRTNSKKEIIINKTPSNNYFKSDDTIKINILARTEEQLKAAIDSSFVDSIYLTSLDLYQKYKHLKNIYYRLPRVNSKYLEFSQANLLVTEIGSIEKYHLNNHLISDYFINVTNSKSIEFLNSKNIQKVTLSVELNKTQIESIMQKNYNVEVIIYGRLELMVMKYCPLKKCLNYCSKCQTSQDKFSLADKFDNHYPLTRSNCLTHIMDKTVIDKIDEIKDYQDMHITNFRLELFDENYDEVINLINKIKTSINNP